MRVKKLEAALAVAHSLTSTDVHPLLVEEERVNVWVETNESPPTMEKENWDEELAGNFSMLAIEGDVKTSRFTTSQYSLWFLDGQEDPHRAASMVERAKPTNSRFPVEILRIAFGPYEDSESIHQRLVSCLPPVHVALSLIDNYYTTGGCIQNIIPQSLLKEEFWPVAYEGRRTNIVSLAVIFGILCLGSIFHNPPLPEALPAERYLHLAILATSQDPLNIVHVEALYLQALYACATDSSLGKPLAILGLIIKYCQTLGIGQGVQTLLNLLLSTCQKVTYEAVLSLDKRLRSYDSILDPQYLKEMGNWSLANGTASTAYDRRKKLQQQFIMLAKECTLVHLHRGFLNRALLNPSEDPILSKWSISVMAAYQSACSVIRQVRLISIHQPELLRMLKWTNAVLSSLIALATLVIRTPFSSLATVAFQELQSGCELLRTHTTEDCYMRPVLDRLRTAAAAAYGSRNQHPSKASANGLYEVRRPVDDPVSAPRTSPPSSESVVNDPLATQSNVAPPFAPLDDIFSGINLPLSNGRGSGGSGQPGVLFPPDILGYAPLKEAQQTHPAGLQEVIGAYLQPPEGTLDFSSFSSQYPAEPDQGGTNWHFLLPNPNSGSNTDSPPSVHSHSNNNNNEQVSDFPAFTAPPVTVGYENGRVNNSSNGLVNGGADADFWAGLTWNQS
ncbi:hypothetical protein FRC17_006261 [Serendipita sp. 399]|nr:hypothetical protein FRC17_006261 [Serendipita sp. 399]